MKVDDIRQGVEKSLEAMWGSMSEGWDRLRRSAAGAITRFRPGDQSNMPPISDVDDVAWMPGFGWSMLGNDVFEDERRVVVRLEAPGMEKEQFDIHVVDDALVVRGEKRFERETTEGRWRVLQCAYGHFERQVPLPSPVEADQARASYRNGILRVELPKREVVPPRRVNVPVS